MSVLRKIFRLLLVSADFAILIALVLIQRPRTRRDRAAWLGRLCSRVMRTIDMSYEIRGPVPPTGAIISNHLTFFDIFLHAASHPSVFISKIELRSFPLLGWISMMAGTVYVERGAGGSAAKAAEGMGKGFRDGLPVVFFPEGTTGTDDTTVLPFRSGLLAQAIMLGQPVHAAHIRYELSPKDIARGKTASKNFYWGPQTLPQIIWEFLGLHEVKATITFAPEPIAFTPPAVENRKIAAVEARDAVLALAASAGTETEPLVSVP